MAGDDDMQFHESTYHSFMKMLRVSAVTCFVIALLVIWLIAS